MRKGLREDYLHFLFEKKILGNSFKTTKGKILKIIDFGERNENAGPDFLDCIISLNGQKWAGPIEFHISASDWFKHRHQDDRSYDNVIAHFVLKNDFTVYAGNYELPVVELSSLIDSSHYNNYLRVLNSAKLIPCASSFDLVPQDIVENEKEKQLQKRMWYKSVAVLRLMNQYQGDTNKLKRVLLARVFGGVVNQQSFEMLVEKITNRELRRLIGKDFEMEAHLFGSSGLLSNVENEDDRVRKLKDVYDHHCCLFGDHPAQLGWKYSRMRPSGFPDVRIAQFSKLLSRIQEMPAWHDQKIVNSFHDWLSFDIDPYWSRRFRLGGQEQKKDVHKITSSFINLLLINAVVPFLYARSYLEGRQDLKDFAIEVLRNIPPEDNKIVRQWKRLKNQSNSAYDSQSFLALQKQGCNQKKCLLCSIGKEVLNK